MFVSLSEDNLVRVFQQPACEAYCSRTTGQGLWKYRSVVVVFWPMSRTSVFEMALGGSQRALAKVRKAVVQCDQERAYNLLQDIIEYRFYPSCMRFHYNADEVAGFLDASATLGDHELIAENANDFILWIASDLTTLEHRGADIHDYEIVFSPSLHRAILRLCRTLGYEPLKESLTLLASNIPTKVVNLPYLCLCADVQKLSTSHIYACAQISLQKVMLVICKSR
jgi:hypothetical protein